MCGHAGQEVTQYTYFQQAAGQALPVPSVEITYGLERILTALQVQVLSKPAGCLGLQCTMATANPARAWPSCSKTQNPLQGKVGATSALEAPFIFRHKGEQRQYEALLLLMSCSFG